MRHPTLPLRRHQHGFSLLEVMISVLLLSFAFLGVAALVAFGIATDTSSMQRSTASIDLYSIMDGLRLDSTAAQNGSYNTTLTSNACPNASSDQVSQNLHTWCEQLVQDFGANSTTQVQITCTTTRICTVRLVFDDSKAGNGGQTHQTYVSQAML